MRVGAQLISVTVLLVAGGPVLAQPPERPLPPEIVVPVPAPPRADGAMMVTDARVIERPRIDAARSEVPDYPPAARRAVEEGHVTLNLCIAANGQVTESGVGVSSGYPRLDAASMKWAAKAQFLPAMTRKGPVAVCGHEIVQEWVLKHPPPPMGSPLPNAMWETPPDTANLARNAWYPMAHTMKLERRPAVIGSPAMPARPPEAPQRGTTNVVHMCVSPTGLAVSVVGLEHMDELSAMKATAWLDSLRFSPAMKDGRPVGACGVQQVILWR